MITTYVYKKKPGKPRPAHTYRASRRNLFIKAEPREMWPGVQAKRSPYLSALVHRNRSHHLDGLPTLSPYR